MRPTLHRVFLVVGVTLILAGILMGHSAEPPLEVRNTYEALEWAQNNGILFLQSQHGYSRELCEMAVRVYMEAHNLSPFSFPYVCWDWRGPPKSRAQVTADILMGTGVGLVAVALPGLRGRLK